MSDVIEGEFTVAPLAVPQQAPIAKPPASLFTIEDPVAHVQYATKVANALVAVIEAKGLAKALNRQKPDEKFVELEGWQLLGSMTKVYAVIEWTKEREDGWEARAQAVTIDGQVVGAGEAVCLRSERNWSNRDSTALKGMAQTRAMSRALRAPLGFIMVLAGYKATAAEELPTESPQENHRKMPPPRHTQAPEPIPFETLFASAKSAGLAMEKEDFVEWLVVNVPGCEHLHKVRRVSPEASVEAARIIEKIALDQARQSLERR